MVADKDLEKLAYYTEMRKRRSSLARIGVLVVVFGLLLVNSYLLYISTNTVVLNIDLARVEQSDQADLLHARIARLERHVAVLEDQLVKPVEEAPTSVADASP